MASGNHVYKGNCADFPKAPMSRQIVMAVAISVERDEAWDKTVL
jgi:hypothetical protein